VAKKRKPTPPPILPTAGRPAQYASRAPYADRRPVHIPDLGSNAAGCLDAIRAAMGAATGREADKVPTSDAVRFALWVAELHLTTKSRPEVWSLDVTREWMEIEQAARLRRQGGVK
jgi:hypothetical protein